MSNCVRLAKKVLKLSENQPMGAIQDADTVLADIMGKSDFQVTRISDELLKMYLDVENKDDFESLFFLIADETFEEYLTKSRDVMQKNINYGTPRVVKVILNDGKFSIFKTDAPEEEIRNCIKDLPASNHADANINDYQYDITVYNNETVKDLRNRALVLAAEHGLKKAEPKRVSIEFEVPEGMNEKEFEQMMKYASHMLVMPPSTPLDIILKNLH